MFSTYSVPAGYCEFKGTGGYYRLTEYAITAATHTYRMKYTFVTGGGSNWGCTIDGAAKTSELSSTLGFASGTYMVAQGEAHQQDVQIGLNAPGKLTFTSLNYYNSSGTAVVLDPLNGTPDSPYGVDKVSASQIRVWTNAH